MNIAQLLADLAEAGINLTVAHGKLTFDAPPGAITDTLMVRMRGGKAELIEALSRPARTSIACPWCRSANLIDHAQGMACSDCGKLAWSLGTDGSLTRCDLPDTTDAAPEDQPICGCGQSMQSIGFDGVWHCGTCEPERKRRTMRIVKRVQEVRP